MEYLDRGGLLYPSLELVSRFHLAYNLLVSILPRLGRTRLITAGLAKFFLPFMLYCNEVLCPRHRRFAQQIKQGHCHLREKTNKMRYLKKFWSYTLRKFISPLVKNHCQISTEPYNKKSVENKPKNRKVTKVVSSRIRSKK